MKITVVQGPFLPVPPVAGGAVEKLWFELSREFARRGHEVTHVSRRWGNLPRRATIDGVEHRRVGSFNAPGSALLSKALDLLYSLRVLFTLPRGDVVITNTFFLPLLLSWLPWFGVVYVSVHRYPRGQMGLYRRTSRLQCVSTAVADAVREQTPDIARLVKVIPNYVPPSRRDADTRADWDRRARQVLFVGRVHPEKGLDLLLDAFARLRPELRANWSLRVVGPHAIEAGGGGADYLAKLKAEAVRRGIAVDFSGPIYDHDALNAAYRAARIFVYPSIAALGEAFPLAPLEAMAQGCAVVTSDLKCFDDFIRPSENALTFPLGVADPGAALCDVLAAAMSNTEQLTTVAAAGERTAQRFTLARIADQFITDFKLLCDR